MVTATTRTYILNMRDGTKQKITVPLNWRLTFGPLVPGSKDGSVNSRDALVLRIYEGNKDNQRAVFTDVVSWRDTNDLQIEVEKVDTQQEGCPCPRRRRGREDRSSQHGSPAVGQPRPAEEGRHSLRLARRWNSAAERLNGVKIGGLHRPPFSNLWA